MYIIKAICHFCFRRN